MGDNSSITSVELADSHPRKAKHTHTSIVRLVKRLISQDNKFVAEESLFYYGNSRSALMYIINGDHSVSKVKSIMDDRMNNSKSNILYVVSNGQGQYKIGITTTSNLGNRLVGLQTGSPYKLNYVIEAEFDNAIEIESNLHILFKEYRMHGEWFAFDSVTLDNVISHIKVLQNQTVTNKKDLSQEINHAIKETQLNLFTYQDRIGDKKQTNI